MTAVQSATSLPIPSILGSTSSPKHLDSPVSTVAQSAIATTASASERDIKMSTWAKISGGLALFITLTALASLNAQIIVGGLVLAAPLFCLWGVAYQQTQQIRSTAKIVNHFSADLVKLNSFKTELAELVQNFLSIEGKILSKVDQISTIAKTINDKWESVSGKLSIPSISFSRSFKDALDHFNTQINYIKKLPGEFSGDPEYDTMLLDTINSALNLTSSSSLKRLDDQLTAIIKSINDINTKYNEGVIG